jgi:hypothetical protein
MAFDLYTTNNVRERAYPTKSGLANDKDAFYAIQANGELAKKQLFPHIFHRVLSSNCDYCKKQ